MSVTLPFARQPVAEALDPPLLHTAEVAAMCRLSAKTIKRLCAESKIWGVVRIGRSIRFRKDLILDWIRAGCPRTAK